MQSNVYCYDLAMLTHNLLITSKQVFEYYYYNYNLYVYNILFYDLGMYCHYGCTNWRPS